MGGTVSVESDVGAGTRFVVRLPPATEGLAPREPDPATFARSL
jgi:hypothetical protein